MDDGYLVRLATPADATAIAELERQVFPDPWTHASIAESLGPMTWVSLVGSTLVGYLFARAAADEGEVLNLAVHPTYRRRGIAGSLLTQAIDALTGTGVRTIYLEVRAANEAARAFYARWGFEEYGRRPGYYRRPIEDAIIMRRKT